MTYDEAMKEVEKLVPQLEHGTLSLNEAMTVWARIQELLAIADAEVQRAQQQVTVATSVS